MYFLKTAQKYWACHTKPLLTRHETCWNVTKCHACHAKRHYKPALKPLTRKVSAPFPIYTATAPQKCAALTMRFAENTQHGTSLHLPRKMTSKVFKVLHLPRNMQRIFWKRREAPATQNDFWHVVKHVGMSQSAMPATRNEAVRRWKPPKSNPFAELTIGTAIRPSRKRLRTVADGCGRLRTAAQRLANIAQPPCTPPEWNGNPCYAFGNENKKTVVEPYGWPETNGMLYPHFLIQSAISCPISGQSMANPNYHSTNPGWANQKLQCKSRSWSYLAAGKHLKSEYNDQSPIWVPFKATIKNHPKLPFCPWKSKTVNSNRSVLAQDGIISWTGNRWKKHSDGLVVTSASRLQAAIHLPARRLSRQSSGRWPRLRAKCAVKAVKYGVG